MKLSWNPQHMLLSPSSKLWGRRVNLLREAYSLLFEWHLKNADLSSLKGEEAFEYMDLITSLPLPTEAKLEDVACFLLHQVMGLAKWSYSERLKVPGREEEVCLGDVARLALRMLASEGIDPLALASRSELCSRFPLGLELIET